jgi:hypothetical protein
MSVSVVYELMSISAAKYNPKHFALYRNKGVFVKNTKCNLFMEMTIVARLQTKLLHSMHPQIVG